MVISGKMRERVKKDGKFYGLLCGLLLGCVLGAAEIPQAAVPFTEKPPEIDGVFDENEWKASCVLKQIMPLGSRKGDEIATEFRLKYDRDHLYVAAVCSEPSGRGPEAYPRPWNDAFFDNDDTVQVVLGVADPEIAVRGKVNVGGYEGAMDNEFTAADFYYTYSVNAVNAQQRQFNEAPQEKPLFRSAVSPFSDGRWVVEMAIPFSGCGLEPAANRKVFANFFRHRAPVMYGWHLPAFGGYNPMPLGEITFLPPGGAGSQETAPAIAEKQTIRKACRAFIGYGPLDGVILGVAEIDGEFGELTGVLEVDGFPAIREKLEFNGMFDRDSNPLATRQAIVKCELPEGDQPERRAKFSVRDASGKVVAEIERQCAAAKMPEWLNTDAGREYVNEKIPRPWTKPQIAGNTVELLDKKISFGENAFPAAVERTGSESRILAAPPQIQVVANGREQTFAFGELQVKPRGNQVAAEAAGTSGPWRLLVHNQLDYDGFMEIKFSLSGGDLKKVDRLTVLLPLDRKIVKFLLPGVSVQRAGELTGAGYRNRAANLWIGNQEEGLAFSFDRNPFRSGDLRRQVEVVQNEDGDFLKLNLADEAGQLRGDEEIFRFFLQPTPTKPYPARPVRGWVTWQWEGWSRWHGYPDLSKTDEVKKLVKELAAKGKKLTLYCCQGLQEDAPPMRQFREDLALQPAWRYYFWQGKNCFATCKRGPEGDLQLHNYRKIIAETGIRGLMSDGLSVPWGDSNPLHGESCGEMTKLSMDRQIQSRVVKQREFLKRIRGLFDATGEEFCLVAHTGGGIDVNTLSFFDSYFEGEQLMRYRRGYYPSEAMFSIGYSGLAWGWRTIYWPKQLHNYDGLDTALAYALLFNSEYYTNEDIDPVNIDVELLERFAKPGNTFHPFWRNHEKIGFESMNCYASLYYGADESLAVVSNLRYGKNSYRLDLSRLYSGRKIEVYDYLRKIPVNSAVVEDALEPFSCRLLVVRPKPEAAAAAGLPKQEAGSEAQWRISGGSRGQDGVIALKAVPGAPASRAELRNFTFGRELSVCIEFIADGRIGVEFGGIDFIRDNGWLFYNKNGEDPAGVVNRFAAARDGWNRLALTVRNGRLNVHLNNKLLVYDKKLDLKPENNHLAFRTWHDNTLSFRLIHARNFVAEDAAGAEEFDIEDQSREWEFGNAAEAKAAGKRLLLRASPEKGLAVADFKRCFRKNLYLEMKVRLPERFNFVMGNITLSYGGGFPGWGWLVRGLADPYSRGWVFQQVPLAGKEYKPLVINLHDGVLNVLYDGKAVVKNLAAALPKGPNSLSVQTWHDDVIDAEIVELSTRSRRFDAKQIHPIRE